MFILSVVSLLRSHHTDSYINCVYNNSLLIYLQIWAYYRCVGVCVYVSCICQEQETEAQKRQTGFDLIETVSSLQSLSSREHSQVYFGTVKLSLCLHQQKTLKYWSDQPQIFRIWSVDRENIYSRTDLWNIVGVISAEYLKVQFNTEIWSTCIQTAADSEGIWNESFNSKLTDKSRKSTF